MKKGKISEFAACAVLILIPVAGTVAGAVVGWRVAHDVVSKPLAGLVVGVWAIGKGAGIGGACGGLVDLVIIGGVVGVLRLRDWNEQRKRKIHQNSHNPV